MPGRSPARESARRRNITIADDVISALDENRMQLALQPIVSTRTREPALYECLLRMAKPDGRIVSAGEFMKGAEQLGLSRLIDRRTLELSIALAKLHPTVNLSLNVSSLTCSDHEWMVTLHRLTGGRRQITERLTIEIAETTAIDDIDQSIAFVDTLKELGWRRHRRLRCRLRVVQEPEASRRRHGQDRRGVHARSVGRQSRRHLHQHHGPARPLVRHGDGGRMGQSATAQMLANSGIDYLQGYRFGKPLLTSEQESPFRLARLA